MTTYEHSELEDLELEELTRWVLEGFTSGRIDGENGKYISWELKIEKWQDE